MSWASASIADQRLRLSLTSKVTPMWQIPGATAPAAFASSDGLASRETLYGRVQAAYTLLPVDSDSQEETRIVRLFSPNP